MVELEPSTSVLIPIHKKGDKKKCTNYRGIFLLSLPEKVYAKCLEKRCCKIAKPQLQDAQCGFCPGRSPLARSLPFTKYLRNCGNMPKRCIHAL